MKNYEKYEDKLKEYKGQNFCKDFVKPNILKSDSCDGLACGACYMLQTIWLLEEYEEPEEPEIDWSGVETDTPILVRDHEDDKWIKRYFAKYKDGKVHAWNSGRTGWTESYMTPWNYAKLAESERKDNINESKTNNRR